MSEQPGVVAPDSFPIRDPRDKNQVVGRIVNPVRYAGFGGFNEQADYDRFDENRSGTITKNPFHVEKPTNVKAAHNSSERKV